MGYKPLKKAEAQALYDQITVLEAENAQLKADAVASLEAPPLVEVDTEEIGLVGAAEDIPATQDVAAVESPAEPSWQESHEAIVDITWKKGGQAMWEAEGKVDYPDPMGANKADFGDYILANRQSYPKVLSALQKAGVV